MRYAAAGFAAGVLAVLGVQHVVYFHLRRIYLRRFRTTP
jgi:hypothetical protein